ncbi:MAG: pyridoxal-phosphate dependent enzyme [Flammeovirgaceae bacterium]|nr:pyridoxal-phosphate dependent enzyme [Flammeovirgaceae bacterium]MDW8286578.1 pyridoxal-phosphate dependent enzyme [Flammeovirgaceae bacterium]
MCSFPDTSLAILQEITHKLTEERKVRLFVKREDLIHPQISGNKWHKLKYNLLEARRQGKHTLLTFGGAFSNHLYAVAAAGKLFDFHTIGIVRGEEHLPLNSTLAFARACGMQLHYMDRATYRNKQADYVLCSLREKFGDFYLLPEGGTNEWAVKGCADMIADLSIDFDWVCCPCGTGGTLAGLASALLPHQHALGIAVLKATDFLEKQVSNLLKDHKRKTHWEITHDYHFGGYAKKSLSLDNFIQHFMQRYQIPLEPVYTGKMMYAVFDLLEKGFFPTGSVIVAIHTGGVR